MIMELLERRRLLSNMAAVVQSSAAPAPAQSASSMILASAPIAWQTVPAMPSSCPVARALRREGRASAVSPRAALLRL